VYVTPAGNGDKSRAVLFIPDVFGIHLVNTQLLADHYAKEANVIVYVPHFFVTDPVPIDLLKNPALLQTYDWPKFMGANSKDLVYPRITNFVKHLKEKEGVTKLGAIGFCYGAWATLQLSRDNLVDAAAVAHPTLVNVPEDIENIKHPSLFLCAETDQMFPAETREKAKEILDKKSQIPYKLKVYPGTQHGFSLRGDVEDPLVRAAADDAASEAVQFFNTYLK